MLLEFKLRDIVCYSDVMAWCCSMQAAVQCIQVLALPRRLSYLTAVITLYVCVMHEELDVTYLHLEWQRQRVQQLSLQV